MQELILLLKNEAVPIDIIECHYKDTNICSIQVQKYKCTQGTCASYFPLPVCGNICGSSVVVCGCLGTHRYELLERFCTFQGLSQSGSTQTKLHNTTPTKRKEKGKSSSLRCKRVLSQSRNKETNKKIKPKSFDTESHSSSNSSHPSKFDFSSPLEKETEIIQSNLENFKEKNVQKTAQRAHTQFNTSLWDAKFCSKDLKRDSAETNWEQFSCVHFIHLSQLQDADPLLYTEICDRRSCTNLVNRFHRKLCSGNVSFQRSYYILRHIKQVHLNQNCYGTHDSVL